MDQREELARLITGTVFNQAGQTMGLVWQPWTVATVADAILAAGWEKRSPAGEAGWRPISEAPRDGTWFLACATAPCWGATRIVRYAAPSDRFPIHGEGHMWPSPPTHWMPLPGLPELSPSEMEG